MKQRYFVFDTEKCIGCFNCLHACKDEHVGNDFSPVTLPQKLHRQYWLTTTQRVRGQFPMIDVAYLTEPCGHCADAPCVKNGNGAVVRRPDGVVLIDPEKARGMGDLSHLCPFGKISYNEEQGVSQKCTFCAHLLDAGWEKPRCVQACPLRALDMELAEPEEMAARVAAGELELLDAVHAACGSRLYVRHLSRWSRCFLGGAAAVTREGRDECAQGCRVTLLRDGSPLAQQEADCYGEFKVDGLEPGDYGLLLELDGFRPRKLDVSLTGSVSLGRLELEAEP